jgi:hypothetical protein
LQPEDFVLFLDENICNCRPILAILDRLGIPYERHLSSFPAGTPDENWLSRVGKEGWILLTTDKSIRWNELERNAVVRHRVREFVFSSGNLSGPDMARALELAIPKMKRLIRRQSAPFIATVTKSGNVDLRFDKSGRIQRKKKS